MKSDSKYHIAIILYSLNYYYNSIHYIKIFQGTEKYQGRVLSYSPPRLQIQESRQYTSLYEDFNHSAIHLSHLPVYNTLYNLRLVREKRRGDELLPSEIYYKLKKRLQCIKLVLSIRKEEIVKLQNSRNFRIFNRLQSNRIKEILLLITLIKDIRQGLKRGILDINKLFREIDFFKANINILFKVL